MDFATHFPFICWFLSGCSGGLNNMHRFKVASRELAAFGLLLHKPRIMLA